MLDTTNLTASISVNPHAVMEATYSIRVLGSDTIVADIQPRLLKDLVSSIAVRASGGSELSSNINPRLVSALPSSIQPRVSSSLASSVSVSAYGVMEADYEVIQPPPSVADILPTKDTFVRSDVPRMNYGAEGEVLVGKLNGAEFDALYAFKASLPQDIRISKAELRLYNLNGLSALNADMYEVNNLWPEYSTTWANKTTLGTKIGSVVLAESIGYQSISVVDKIHSGDVELSFLLKPTDDTGIARLSTKESQVGIRPALYIEYYDLYPKSSGMSKRMASITVRRSDELTLPASITVASHNLVEELQASIEVPIYYESKDLVASINVSNAISEYLDSSIFIPIYDRTMDLEASIAIRVADSADLVSSILIPIYDRTMDLEASIAICVADSADLVSSIFIPIYDRTMDLEASIYAKAYAWDDLDSSIQVPIYDRVKDLPASIVVPIHDRTADKTASIFVPIHDRTADLVSDILIPIYDRATDLASSIYAKAYAWDDLDASIQVPIYDRVEDLASSIYVRAVSNKDLASSVTIPIYDRVADLQATMFTRATGREALEASITVPIYDIVEDLQSSIDPRYAVSLPSSIVVQQRGSSDLNSVISARPVTVLPANIKVISGYLAASIQVPHRETIDIPASMQVQVRMINDLECMIKVGGANGAYAFIM